MTFSEYLAGRVAELERDKEALRRKAHRLERSRDLWRIRALRKAGLRG